MSLHWIINFYFLTVMTVMSNYIIKKTKLDYSFAFPDFISIIFKNRLPSLIFFWNMPRFTCRIDIPSNQFVSQILTETSIK